jgi:hypothetical protein
MELPFTQQQISKNTFIRHFSQGVDSEELTWHRDRESRIIESIEPTDWQIQLDNELPKKIEGQILIPEGQYHRLIRGTGNLQIKLIKLI